MKKPTLLLLCPYKFTEFDWYRYEFSLLEKEYNVEVKIHVMIDFLFPHFSKVYQDFKTDERISTFNTFKEWKKAFHKIVKEKKSEILVIKNAIHNENLLSLLVNIEVKKAGVRVIEYGSIPHPEYINVNTKYLYWKFFSFIKNPKTIKFFLTSKILNFVGDLFKLYPTHVFKAGSKGFKSNFQNKNVKIVEANAFDYSMYLNSKNKDSNFNEQPYGLFLEAPTPLFDGDNLFIGQKSSELGTSKIWFPALIKFFNELEILLKFKIKIAPHPKVKHKNFPKYYGGREIINQKLADASKNAKLLITRESAGLSFASLYDKPAIMINSYELMKNKIFTRKQKYQAEELGIKIMNIDEKLDSKEMLNALKVDKKKYEEYKFNYLTSRKDEKANYKIIGDLLI